jgi:hypothetical protein
MKKAMEAGSGCHEYTGLRPDDRRSFERHALSIEASICGPDGQVRARTVDLSAGGVLLRVEPADALGADIAHFVERVFGEAVKVRFSAGSFAARARIVRVERRPSEPESVFLGCRFALNLHAMQLRRLGLEPSECGCGHQLERAQSSILPLETDDSSRVVVHPRGEDAAVCDGRLVGLGGLVLTAEVHAGERDHLVSSLDGRDLSVHVKHEEESVEVALLAASAPGPEVTSRFSNRLPLAG